MKKLKRTVGSKAMLFGVCGGLGEYFEVDPTIIRILTALLTIFSVGGLLIAYIVMALVMPKEDF